MGCTQSDELHLKSDQLYTKVSNDVKVAMRTAIACDDLREMVCLIDEHCTMCVMQASLFMQSYQKEEKCGWRVIIAVAGMLKDIIYIKSPKNYVANCNQQNNDGQSCMHICSIWNGVRCFKVLKAFGGLCLNIHDHYCKDPLATALDYRCKYIATSLKSLKSEYDSFMLINHEKINKPLDLKRLEKDEDVEEQKDALFDLQSMCTAIVKHSEEQTRLLEQQAKIIAEKQIIHLQLVKLEEQNASEKASRKEISDSQLKDPNENCPVDDKEVRLRQQFAIKCEELFWKSKQLQQVRSQQLHKKIEAQQSKVDTLLVHQPIWLKQFDNITLQILQEDCKILPRKSNLQSSFTSTKRSQILEKELPMHLQELYTEAKKNGVFIDHTFPHCEASLGQSKHKTRINSIAKQVVWLRPAQFISPDYDLFEGIDPNDVKQGQLGICYALATISLFARDPQKVMKLFGFYDLEVGFYVLRFYKNGCEFQIPVDDFIPCHPVSKQPLFTRSIGKQIWVLLIEKAWAKAVGSYFGAETMTPDSYMQDFSGAPSYGYYFKDLVHKTKDLTSKSLQNHLVVVVSGHKPIKGIVNNHAYSLLKTIKHGNNVIYKLRNPWGRFEWNGMYGQESPLWTAQLIKLCEFVKGDDGIFFITESELLEAFVYYSISINEPHFKYSYTQFQSKKSQNVYYTFELPHDSMLNLRITQPFEKMIDDPNYQYSSVIFEVGRIEARGKITFLTQGHNKCYFGDKSVHADEEVLKMYKAGRYFVRIKIMWKMPEKYNRAVLSVFTSSTVVFTKMQDRDGERMLKELMINYVENLPVNNSGNFKFRMEWMRGQLICYAYLQKGEEGEQCYINWTCDPSKLKNCELGIGKISENVLSFQVGLGKANANIGTIDRLVIYEMCSSGSIAIHGTKT